MVEEPFAEGTTLLHQMNAAAKIIAAIIFILPAATTDSIILAAGYGVLSIILATLARLPFIRVFKRLLLVNSFTLFLLITLPLTFGGESFYLFSHVPVSKEGLRIGLLIGIKTNTILIGIIALLNTSSLSKLGHGLEKLKVPLRFCYLLLFTYRYIFVIEQEFKRLLRAAQMRSFAPSTTLHTYRTYGYLVGMTLVKSWEQAHRVHQAMLLRGFTGRFIPLSHSAMDAKGYLLIIIVSLYCSTLVLIEHLPG